MSQNMLNVSNIAIQNKHNPNMALRSTLILPTRAKIHDTYCQCHSFQRDPEPDEEHVLDNKITQ